MMSDGKIILAIWTLLFSVFFLIWIFENYPVKSFFNKPYKVWYNPFSWGKQSYAEWSLADVLEDNRIELNEIPYTYVDYSNHKSKLPNNPVWINKIDIPIKKEYSNTKILYPVNEGYDG